MRTYPTWVRALASALALFLTCIFSSACNSSGGRTPASSAPVLTAADPSILPPPLPLPGPGSVGSPTPTPAPTPAPLPAPSAAPAPAPAPEPAPSPVGSQPIALVYGGPGVLYGRDDTLVRAEFVAARAGFKVVEVNARVDSEVLNSASVWVQPGGPNLSADAYMNRTGMAEQVRDFVRRGGGYVGFCGGAFSAVNNLGLIAGTAWNWPHPTAKIPINWLGTIRFIHFEDGPYIVPTSKTTQVIGTYPDGQVAVVRDLYGKGQVFISGVHPEANSDWPPAYDPDGPDVDLAVAMIRSVAALPERSDN